MTVAQIERLRTFWVVKEDVEDEQQAPGGASLADLDMDDGGGQGVVPEVAAEVTPGDGDVIDSSTEGGHDVVIVELGGTARIVQQLDQPAFKTVKAKAAPAAAGGGGEQGSGDGAAAPQAAAPPQAPSRRPRLEPLKSLNIFLSLREHSFLALSLLGATSMLLDFFLRDVSFIYDCTCDCGSMTPSIQDCWAAAARKAARRKRVVKYPVMAVIWVAVISIVLRKLLLDHSLVTGVEYGTLEYVLRLELRKQYLTNRVMTLQFMALCLVAMSALVLTNIAKDPTLEGFYQVAMMPIELGLQLLAGFVLLSDVGFLTPVSVMDVPHVKLPMRIWETSEMAAAKLMKIATLSDAQILALPGNLKQLKAYHLSSRYVRQLSAADLLAIKLHLHKTDGSTYDRRSRQRSNEALRILNAIIGRRRLSSSSSGLERLGSRSTSVMPMTEPDRPTGDGGGDESRGRPASTVRGRGGGEDRPDAPAALVVNPLQQVEHRDNK